MDNNQLEKNFWKAGQTPLSATNLNLMTNAIIDNAEAISEVVKVSVENGIKINSEGQLELNPATNEEIQNSTGNKAITPSNLPNASREKKGIVKLGSNFVINESGELDIPTITIDNPIMDADGGTLTDEQINTILNNENVLINVSFPITETGILKFYISRDTILSVNNNPNCSFFSTTTNIDLYNDPYPIWFCLVIDFVNKKYFIHMFEFTNGFYTQIVNNNFEISLRSVTGEPKGNAFYIHSINGEQIASTTTSTDITTSLKFTNITVSNWTRNNTYADYPYEATITKTGVTSSMVAEVTYGIAEAISGNYAPICETFNGGINIYSKVDTSITIPTILVVK